MKEYLEGARKHKLVTDALRKKLPKLYSQDGKKDPMVYMKLFSPYSGYTLYVTEFDGNDTFFGYVTGMAHDEWGYASYGELQMAERNGLPLIERDKYFTPGKFSKVKGK